MLVGVPAVMGWSLTIYKEEDCNDRTDDFEYVSNDSLLEFSVNP